MTAAGARKCLSGGIRDWLGAWTEIDVGEATDGK